MNEIKTLTPSKVYRFKESKDGGPIIINTKNGEKQVYKVGVKFQELDDDNIWYATAWDQEDDRHWKIQEGKEYTVKLDKKYNSWSFPNKSDRQMAEILNVRDEVRKLKFTVDERVVPLLEKIAGEDNGLEDDFNGSDTDKIHENAGDDIDPENIPF